MPLSLKGKSGKLLADRLHKTTVSALFGLTLVGLGLSGLRIQRYFTVIRPNRIERERLEEEELMRSRQTEREAELMRQQSSAESLQT